jgi:hypothetical protein
VEVGPLAPEDARRLALALLDSDGPQARRAAESIARESGGSPFLIEELARSASGYRRAALPDQSSLSSSVTLEQMIAERASRLPDDAQRLLQVIAVAGRPLPVATLREAANVADSTPRLVALLRTRRFVRAGLRGGIETIETSHNRIRETIVARLPAEDARRHHARVALALESAPDSDPEAIATHLLGAGDRERASRYAERAAEQAVAKLAFAQAGRLFQLAIDTSATASAAEQQSLRLRLAKAWEWAGQAEKAALAYLAAAKHAAAGDRIELERAAAAQLIAAGRIDEGVAAFHRLLGALDIAVPRSRFWILFLTTFYRIAAAAAVALFWRIRRRDKGDSSAPDHRRLGTLHAMARALAVLDPVSANYLKARYLFEALRSGSLSHKIRSAILEAGSLGAIGKGKSRKERSLFATARRLAEQSGDEEGLGLYDLTYGISEYLRGRWRSAVELLGRAQARLSAVRAWQANAGVYRVFALVSLGELLEVKARTNALLADAERRGDRFTFASLLASHATAAWLASDDAQAARRQLKSAIAGWSKTSFLVQHWQCALWEAETHLYLGEGEQAWQRLARDERRLATSAFARIQLIRSLTLFIRGRSAVASLKSLDGRARRTRLSEARRALGRLKAEAMPYTDALAAMLGASVAKATNDSATAEHELRQAILYAERAEMAVHAAAARYQLGLLLGGRSGSAMLTETETTMRARGVRVPARYAQMLVPGDWPADSAAQPGR